MAEEQDDAQKTEEPTRKRLEDAAERGQVVTSRETTSFLLLLAFTLLFGWIGPALFHRTARSLAIFIQRPEDLPMDRGALGRLLAQTVTEAGGILLVPFVAFVAAILLSNALQNRFVFSFEPLMPKLEKISPLRGLSRLFSLRAFIEFAKSVIKMTVVGVVAYLAVAPYFTHLKQLPDVTVTGTLAFLAATAKRMLIGICIVMFFIAVLDFLYQRYEFLRGLRMSKQEIRDEYKQQEGDPQVKQRLRQIRMERARRRMIAAVPTADVVVTNPTHYSVALKYDATTMGAPRVVAKGVDDVALRIRDIAREHDVPLFANPPLAQALYAAVEIDREIPTAHYKAVAEVISYVYRLRGRPVRAPR